MKTAIDSVKNFVFFAVARYFGFWADIVLRRWQPTTIVVTGSSGKTTLINMLALQFGSKALVSLKYNSTYGIPFHILGLKGTDGNKMQWVINILLAPIRAFRITHKQRFYIAEADASMPGEGKFLAKLLKPTFTAWVSSARTHSVYFDRLVEKGDYPSVDEAIAAEYAHFALNTQDTLFTDGDNHDIAHAIEDVADNMVLENKQIALKQYSVDVHKSAFMLTNKRIYRFKQPQPEALGYQVVMMDKLLDAVGIEPKLSLEDMKQPPGRSSVFKGRHGATIIDSTYNANLDSVITVLDLFAKIQSEKRVLVLGDMLEQGSVAAKEHKKLAQHIGSSGLEFEQIVLIGDAMTKYTKPGLEKLGITNVHAFTQTRAVLDHLLETLSGDELIMFKGSQGQMLEGVVEKLLKNPTDAAKLPRQSALWKRRRAAIGL